MANPDEEFYIFHVKIAYTDIKFECSFNPDITIKHFIEILKQHVNREHPNNHNMEIVEAGQYFNINGRAPELAPKINYDNQCTLKDIYGKNWKNTAFYIRFSPIFENSWST
jgi:hypothetical protein